MVLPNGDTLPWSIDRHPTNPVHSHGTILLGIVAALPGNDIGVRGVLDLSSENPEGGGGDNNGDGNIDGGRRFRFIHTRALKDDRTASQSQMIDAVNQCVEYGNADVIIVAMGCVNCPSDAVRDFFQRAYDDAGVLVVGAAGNQGYEGEGDDGQRYMYPASYPGVISVAAVDEKGRRMDGSNANDAVELAAHGDDVLSTFVSPQGELGYARMKGTSAATAYVGAAAALLWSYHPTCTNVQIRNALIKTALHDTPHNGDGSPPPPPCDNNIGYGVPQILDTVLLLRERGCDGGGIVLSDTGRACDRAPPPSSSSAPREAAEGVAGQPPSSSFFVVVGSTGGGGGGRRGTTAVATTTGEAAAASAASA